MDSPSFHEGARCMMDLNALLVKFQDLNTERT